MGGVTGVTFGRWGNLWRIRQEPKQQQQPLHTIPHRHRPFLGGLVAVVVAGVDVDFVLRKYQSYWGQLLVLQVGNHLDTQAHTQKRCPNQRWGPHQHRRANHSKAVRQTQWQPNGIWHNILGFFSRRSCLKQTTSIPQ